VGAVGSPVEGAEEGASGGLPAAVPGLVASGKGAVAQPRPVVPPPSYAPAPAAPHGPSPSQRSYPQGPCAPAVAKVLSLCDEALIEIPRDPIPEDPIPGDPISGVTEVLSLPDEALIQRFLNAPPPPPPPWRSPPPAAASAPSSPHCVSAVSVPSGKLLSESSLLHSLEVYPHLTSLSLGRTHGQGLRFSPLFPRPPEAGHCQLWTSPLPATVRLQGGGWGWCCGRARPWGL